MDQVEVQMQDSSGNWRTYRITNNEPLAILTAMREVQQQFPDARIRAVDQNGRVVDMM